MVFKLAYGSCHQLLFSQVHRYEIPINLGEAIKKGESGEIRRSPKLPVKDPITNRSDPFFIGRNTISHSSRVLLYQPYEIQTFIFCLRNEHKKTGIN